MSSIPMRTVATWRRHALRTTASVCGTLFLIGCQPDPDTPETTNRPPDVSVGTVNNAVPPTMSSRGSAGSGSRLDAASSYSVGYVSVSGFITPRGLKADAPANLVITIQPSTGWHVYAHAEDGQAASISKPTVIQLQLPDGWTANTPQPDQPVIEKEDEIFRGNVIRYHQGPVSFTVPLNIPANAPAKTYVVSGVVGFQACADDDSSCDRPSGAQFETTLTVGKNDSSPAPLNWAAAKYP